MRNFIVEASNRLINQARDQSRAQLSIVRPATGAKLERDVREIVIPSELRLDTCSVGS